MDAAAGLDNNASNPFANNDAATTGEHVQKDPFLLDLDSFKQQATDINSVPNNDFFLGLEHSTNGKRSADNVFDDDDFGPETNVDGDGDNIQSQEHINDNNSSQQSYSDENLEIVKDIDHDSKQFRDEEMQTHEEQMSPARVITETVNNSNNANLDGLLSRLEEEMDLAMEREFNKVENEFAKDEFVEERVTEKEDGANPIVADDVHDGNLVDNVADSGEESEDEWNYFKGNTAADADKENIDPTEKIRTVDNLEGDELDMSQLNPNAAEFVPVSPTRNTSSPACMALINDTIYAQSPKRIPTEPVDMDVPEPNDFETEIRNRPSEVFNTNNGHVEPDVDSDKKAEVMENLLNGKNADESDFQSSKSSENFHFGPNATPFSTPAKFLDDSEAFSTKANFGDESTATYMDSTSTFSPEKNMSADSNNPFGDQSDFQAIMNKESDPMSMSFYQDKDDKSDTNPFDLNKVHMLPDDLDDFLAKPDEKSDLPEHDQQQQMITDLDKPSQDEELLSGVRELPKSPIEDIKTPEPTFDENLCPNNEVIEKENTENVSENIETRNMDNEINDLCGQIKDMAVDDTSFTESEIEFNAAKPDQPVLIPEQPEELHFIEQQPPNIDNQFIEQHDEPQICVMKMQEGTNLIECHMVPSQFEVESNQAISPEPIKEQVPFCEPVCNAFSPEILESPQPIIETFAMETQSTMEPPLLSPEPEVEVYQPQQIMEPELIETPVDDITSSIKDDVSPVQLTPSVDLIPDLPAEEPTIPEVAAPIVEAAVAVVAGVATVAAASAVIKKTPKETPLKKPPSSKTSATPRSASKVTATTPKVGATSPTKSASKPLSAAKAPTPRPTAATRPSGTASAGKLSSAAPRPKTAPTSIKPTATKPLLNGEQKTAAPKPRALPLTKTSQPSKPTPTTRLSPTKPLAKPLGSTRPSTAPATSKSNAPKPSSALGAVSKPKPTATSVARATSGTSKLSSATSVTKTSTTVTKTFSSTLTSTNKSTAMKSSTTVPPKPRAPITRAAPGPKAPDAEKQNKENVNKQTASRTAATSARSNALTNGKPSMTVRKIEPKVAGITAKTTVTKSTTATTTRLAAPKKPIATDTNRPITKTATKTVTKTAVHNKPVAKLNGLPNGLSENTTTTTTVIENNDLICVADNTVASVDDLVGNLKDNSPIMENSQLINANAAD